MKKIKLVVISVFLLSLAVFEFSSSSAIVSGQVTLTAPTGVNASDAKYPFKVRVGWDTIRNATTYRILRNTTNNPATATVIGNTPANTFFDTSAPQGQTFFYWVRAENASTTSNLSDSDQGGSGVVAFPTSDPSALEAPGIPTANPMTATKVSLGKALFWDEQLSSTRTVSCGTCHINSRGGSDPRSLANNARALNAGFDNLFGTADDVVASPGVPLTNPDGSYLFSSLYGVKEQVTSRKSNSTINAAYITNLFWDGRALPIFRDPITNALLINGGGALESQIIAPPVNSSEMGHAGRNWTQVAARVAEAKALALSPGIPAGLKTWIGGRSYPELFLETFGTTEVTPARIAFAIAAYERTLYSDQAPFDTSASGLTQLTQQEIRGRNVFNGAQCGACHGGNLFTNQTFINIGVRPTNEDTGRFQVTGNQGDLGEFKVPSLRNVELRAPYMHNGRFATLEDVVEFYNRGGDFRNAPNFPGNLIQPRNLSTQAKADLVAFLKRPLTDPRVTTETGPFERPQLYSESNRVPIITGTGIAGANGIIPAVAAIEPPLAGNPAFTVALSGALGGTNAVLVINDTDPGATSSIPASGSFARVAVTLQGNGAGNGFGSVSLPIPENAAIIGKTFFGRWYVTDANANGGTAVSQAFRFTVFGEAVAPARARHADFDGDGKTDVSVFRPSDGNWYILRSSDNSFSSASFGIASDKLTPEDFDGDGKTDVAVFRDGAWYIQRSRDGLQVVNFGAAGDKPQPADYDGDGIADAAVFRPSNGTWYVQQSRDGFAALQFGAAGDRPVAADYDGDGKADFGVYRDGNWYLQRSAAGFTGIQFGIGEDKPVLGDYDGDGKADIAVYRPSTGGWYYLRSADNSFGALGFGVSTDTPSPGDYDGDGKNDFAVFRSGNWYLMQSANNAFRAQAWGADQDVSVPAAIVP